MHQRFREETRMNGRIEREQGVWGRRLLAVLVACVPVLGLGACSARPYPLNANLTLDQTRAVVAANFPAGMPLDGVRTKLEELRVKRGDQMLYEATATRPKVLLARLWEPGGFWVTETDEEVKWTDLSFVFGPSDKLEKTLIFQDGNRYFQGRPVYPPSRPLAGGVRDWPAPPGPPMDPLEKAVP